MPNFPYPWYISQVRAGLWAKWSARKPAQPEECIVEFSIMPGGQIVDVRDEETSGDAAFDLAAMGAAQDAAPFPPLPRDFKEPFLKIHVTLKSQ
jgi:TonB family protein